MADSLRWFDKNSNNNSNRDGGSSTAAARSMTMPSPTTPVLHSPPTKPATPATAPASSGGGGGTGAALSSTNNAAVAVAAPATNNDRRSSRDSTAAFDAREEGDPSPLIVFDWDDTMLTSSWIQTRDLLQAGTYRDLPLDARRSLAHLEHSAIKCLTNARGLGTVIIITNAESGWVELSAAKFFVNLLPLLEGIPVVSARTLFEGQFPGSPLCWKAAAFAYMMHEHFVKLPRWTPKIVVSIGDSNEEKVALRIASGQHSSIAAKAVKFMMGPDPEALAAQLDIVTASLATILARDGDAELILSPAMINGSDCRGPPGSHRHQHHRQRQHYDSLPQPDGGMSSIDLDPSESCCLDTDNSLGTDNDMATSAAAPDDHDESCILLKGRHKSSSPPCTSSYTTTATHATSTATSPSTSACSPTAGARARRSSPPSSSSYPVPIPRAGSTTNRALERYGGKIHEDDVEITMTRIAMKTGGDDASSSGGCRHGSESSCDSSGSGGGSSAPSPFAGWLSCDDVVGPGTTAATSTSTSSFVEHKCQEVEGEVSEAEREERGQGESEDEFYGTPSSSTSLLPPSRITIDEGMMSSTSSPIPHAVAIGAAAADDSRPMSLSTSSPSSLSSSSSSPMFVLRHPATPKRSAHSGCREVGGADSGGRGVDSSYGGGDEADGGSPGGPGGGGVLPLGAMMASGRGASGDEEDSVGGGDGMVAVHPIMAPAPMA